MSFHNKGFWMPKDGGCLTDGEMTYDNSSRIEPKRAHQWFTDATEVDLFPNKKQAIEAAIHKSISEIPNVNIPPWENAPSFQSVPGHFTDRLFGPDGSRAINFGDRNISSVGTVNLNMGRKGFEEHFGSDPSVGLSISHTLEDPAPCLSYGGIRKVKVNQVKESDGGMSISMGPAFSRGDNSMLPIALNYNKSIDNSMSMGHTYDKDNIISMGHPYNKSDGGITSMGHTYNKGGDNIISIGQTFNKGNETMISMAHSYDKEDDNKISMGHIYNRGDNNIISIGHLYDKADSNTISFGGSHDEQESNSSGRLISNYDYLMSQSSVQTSVALNEKELVESNGDAHVNSSQISTPGTENTSKSKSESKLSKKAPPNNFPSNVRSLLSTGILDGVTVKYISWSREKELRGVIKGSGYLCGCQSCNLSKALNAYEFERHAGCKTKHPNNHIFFENGKTVYGIVQELRSTPQNMLFDAIETVTGTQINQKNFRLWKESFLAATRELQRIYGTDEINQIL